VTASDVAEQEDGHPCWCCGRTFPESSLFRLGAHPEAAVCFVCARFLHRQARQRADALHPSTSARARSVVRHARATVMDHGWQGRPVVGPALRWIDRFLP
jgi:hypothetical protein